jgi:mutator protein MutT
VSAFDGDFAGRVRRNLASFVRLPSDVDGRRPAAVAVALLPDETGEACFLLTRRAATLRAHARQWALPGGRIEAGETPEAAALRELHEEVGLACESDAVLGLLDDYPTRSGFLITPVVVWAGAHPPLTPDAAEVAAVYRVPLSALDVPDSPRFVRIPESDRPVIQVPIMSSLVHAPTAAVLYQVREVLLHGRATRVAHFEQPVWAWR